MTIVTLEFTPLETVIREVVVIVAAITTLAIEYLTRMFEVEGIGQIVRSAIRAVK